MRGWGGRLTIIGLFSLLFISCDGEAPTFLEREVLFSLGIGRLEDQVDLYSGTDVVSRGRSRLVMRDGIFYISNETAGKVMIFNSYGDLFGSYYHPDENPAPVTLQQRNDQTALTTKFAVPYRFNMVGEIAVDSDKNLSIVDMLPPERTVFDSTIGVNLDWTILRFTDDGTFMDYLGQEGIGGTPFPKIDMMRTNTRDELMVICGTTMSKLIFLFSKTGDLIYRSEIPLDRLPVPELDEDGVAVLDGIAPGFERRRVYLKISYYTPSIDEQTGKEFGIRFEQSRIYWLDLDTGFYESYVDVPESGQYEFVGVSRGTHLFLVSYRDDDSTELVIMNLEGRVVRRRLLEFSEYELYQRYFYLDASGILSAFLAYPSRVEIAWWRTDRLLPRGGVF